MKHISFYGKIERLENLIDKLKYLADKVEGVGTEPSCSNKAEKHPTPSLTYFLNEQPERLDKMNADLLSQIERLEQMLF